MNDKATPSPAAQTLMESAMDVLSESEQPISIQIMNHPPTGQDDHALVQYNIVFLIPQPLKDKVEEKLITLVNELLPIVNLLEKDKPH